MQMGQKMSTEPWDVSLRLGQAEPAVLQILGRAQPSSATAGAGMLSATAQLCSGQALSLQVVHGMLSPTHGSFGLDHTCSPHMGPSRGTGTLPREGKGRLGTRRMHLLIPRLNLGTQHRRSSWSPAENHRDTWPQIRACTTSAAPAPHPKPEGCHQHASRSPARGCPGPIMAMPAPQGSPHSVPSAPFGRTVTSERPNRHRRDGSPPRGADPCAAVPSVPSFLSHPPALRLGPVPARAAVTENKAVPAQCPSVRSQMLTAGVDSGRAGGIEGPCQAPAGRGQCWQ